jgi:hypothetical protein
MADQKQDKAPDLADIDPIFKKEIDRQDEERRRRDEDIAKGRKPDDETQPPSKISFEDRMLYDLAGVLGGQSVARMLDSVARRLPEPVAGPMRSAGFETAGMGTPKSPRAPLSAAPAAPMGAPMAGAAPVGGPAGPVGGPPSVVRVQQPPMGGPGAYNYGKAFGLTDIEAARALDMTKNPGGANDLIRQRAEALNRIQQMGGGYVENPRFGGLMTPEQGAGQGPRASFVQQSAVPANPDMPAGRPGGLSPVPTPKPIPLTEPPPGALDRFLTAGKGVAKAVAGSPLVTGVLGGLATAEGVQEYFKRQQEGDIPGQVMAGMGALGGGMTLMPHPVTKAVGAGLGALSPLTLYLYDKMRQREQQQPLKPRIPEPGTNFPPSEMLLRPTP